MPRTRVALAAAAALSLAAPPGVADGAALETDRRCYSGGQSMTITGTGWVAGSTWSVIGDQISASGTADGGGAFTSTTEEAPLLGTDSIRPETIRLSGIQDGRQVTSTTFEVVSFLAAPRKPRGNPTRTTIWDFSGFAPDKLIYIHVRRGSKTYTTKVGRGDPTCGTTSEWVRRLPGVPASEIRRGTYAVFVDNRRTFSRGGLQFRATITL